MILVVGAGAFGGWTALSLLRRGATVTLLDAWGPGNARASSGGETRIIRAGYGDRDIYTRMAARALSLWQEHDDQFGTGLFQKTGALWMSGPSDTFLRASHTALTGAGVPANWLKPAGAAIWFPQISFEGVTSVLFEPEAGYLHARRACAHVVDQFQAEGGTYRVGAVTAMADLPSRVTEVAMLDGSTIGADAFVFACGPWLGTMFPDVIGARITPTRQETLYFGTPAGDPTFDEHLMPVWLDMTDRVIYGIPGHGNRGFKIADDTPGPPIDPTTLDRAPTASHIDAARAFLQRRFPRLSDAPFLGAEVCQYEATADSDFILDRHPAASNVWLAGGGSGHGFKMGPAIGELMAAAVLDATPLDRRFRGGRVCFPEKQEKLGQVSEA
jgi:sarcosine oxidase